MTPTSIGNHNELMVSALNDITTHCAAVNHTRKYNRTYYEPYTIDFGSRNVITRKNWHQIFSKVSTLINLL